MLSTMARKYLLDASSMTMLYMYSGQSLVLLELVHIFKMQDSPWSIDEQILFDFINLTQVHNFTVSARDIFTFRRLSVFTVSFKRILQVLMQK